MRVKQGVDAPAPVADLRNNAPGLHKEVGLIMQSELVGLRRIDQADIKNQDPVTASV
jgi:hypothetical protein